MALLSETLKWNRGVNFKLGIMEKKTLVIHPKDSTTDCLSVIYEGRGWTVIRDVNTSNREVERQLKVHDRIIMLGHGTPYGLLCGDESGNRFVRYIISDRHARILRNKETFSIWCNSDAYFEHYGMGGLHTGMIVSEVGEEMYIFKKAILDEEEMAKNMELFCGAFAKYIDLEPEEMKVKVLEEYVGDDEVTIFNRTNIRVLQKRYNYFRQGTFRDNTSLMVI